MDDFSQNSPSTRLPLSRVFLNTEVALLQLHLRILRCEEQIFDSSHSGSTSLQDLDFVSQSLEYLAKFLATVAVDLGNDPVIDLHKSLNQVALETLASVLASGAPTKEDLAKLAGLTEPKGVDLF